jgi:hypothetical protein
LALAVSWGRLAVENWVTVALLGVTGPVGSVATAVVLEELDKLLLLSEEELAADELALLLDEREPEEVETEDALVDEERLLEELDEEDETTDELELEAGSAPAPPTGLSKSGTSAARFWSSLACLLIAGNGDRFLTIRLRFEWSRRLTAPDEWLEASTRDRARTIQVKSVRLSFWFLKTNIVLYILGTKTKAWTVNWVG